MAGSGATWELIKGERRPGLRSGPDCWVLRDDVDGDIIAAAGPMRESRVLWTFSTYRPHGCTCSGSLVGKTRDQVLEEVEQTLVDAGANLGYVRRPS